MAHEVENMFYVGDIPWHKLGKRFIEAPDTMNEAIAAAGLNWEVGTKPLFTEEQEKVPALATFRKSDNKILGVVGPTYHPLQNVEAFNFFQPFIDSKLVTLESAGSLRGGQRVWVLAKIKGDPLVVKGNDVLERYILLSNSHDGTLAVRVGFTPVRVVCANTMRMAHTDQSSKLIRVRHTKGVVRGLEAIRETMDVINREFTATADVYRKLASTSIVYADLKKYIKEIFVQQATQDSDRAGDKVMAEIIPLFDKGRGNDMPEVKGTVWTAYNSVTEYLQYYRGKTEDTRLDSVWFGQGSTLSKKALDLAIDYSKAA